MRAGVALGVAALVGGGATTARAEATRDGRVLCWGANADGESTRPAR